MSNTVVKDRLTPEEEAVLPEYTAKWDKAGMSCEPADWPRAEAGLKDAYSKLGYAEPQIVHCTSPAAMSWTRAFSIVLLTPLMTAFHGMLLSWENNLARLSGTPLRKSDQYEPTPVDWTSQPVVDVSRLKIQWHTPEIMRSVLGSIVDTLICLDPGDPAEIPPRLKTECMLVIIEAMNAMSTDKWQQLNQQLTDSIHAATYGQHDASWLVFHDFFRNACGLVAETEQVAGLIEVGLSAGWFIPNESICWLADRTKCLNLNARNQLHCDGGQAVGYRDGWGLWLLNGVSVTQAIAETPSADLDCKLILTEQNAEIRREIWRKIGAERALHNLGAESIHAEPANGYELLSFKASETERWNYLKMAHPSIPELWCVEGVSNECRTVQDALNFRNSLTPDMIDDINGVDWFQQGDVVLKPLNAKKFKSRPKILQ